MANVMHHHIDFHPRPVSHAPSPFGFGFGLGLNSSNPGATSWATQTPGHSNVAAFQQLASSINQSSFRAQKRRHDSDEDGDAGASPRDELMDRSPTPERPRRAAPKRARIVAVNEADKENATSAESKRSGTSLEDDVDVGVLLASLPSQSLLPLLTALLKVQPSLKSTIVPLIPRPTLETALEAVAHSAKKLRESYPYSNSLSSSQGSVSFGFGQAHQSSCLMPQQQNSGMRDSYIVSRLRPHITDFVSCCISYLPYFTCILSMAHPPTSSQLTSAIQTLHKDKFHPSETFLFLSAVTNHLLSQPPLTISSIAPLFFPRLIEEWQSWVDKVDEVVNRQAGMFGSETVRNWERGLDEFAGAKAVEVSTAMRQLRDRWVTKVGWLVGRMVQHAMDEV